MKTILLFLVLILSVSVYSQTKVTGIIKDKEGKAIKDVKISVKNTKVSTKSNSAGKYEIEVPIGYKVLEFYHSDYAIQVLEIVDNEINLTMKPISEIDLFELSLEELMNIKISTAGKTEQNLNEIPASVVVITKSDIEKYGYLSLDEVLENVLGFYKHDDFRNLNFGVRGFFTNIYNRNVIIMVNGIDQKLISNGSVQMSGINIPVSTIDKIEIVRGPMSVIYGNDAFFGAINIITNDITENAINSHVSYSYGSENSNKVDIKIAGKSNNIKYAFVASNRKTDGRDIDMSLFLDSIKTYADPKKWVTDATTKDFFKTSASYFNFSGEYNGFYTNISYAQSARNILGVSPPLYGGIPNSFSYTFANQSIGWRKEINKNFNFNVSLDNFFNKAHNKYDNLFPSVKYGRALQEHEKYSIDATLFYTGIEHLNIMLGANYTNQHKFFELTDVPLISITSNYITMLKKPVVTQAVYSQIEYRLLQKLLIVAGMRIEKQNAFTMQNKWFQSLATPMDTTYSYTNEKVTIVPRAALVYNLNNKNIIKLMYGKGLSRPSITENCFYLGSYHDMLTEQYITTTEISVSSFIYEKVNINASLFYNIIDNMITRTTYWNDTQQRYILTNANSGNYQTLGAETQIIYKINRNIYFDISASYQKTDDLTNKVDAAYSPNILIYAKVAYKVTPKITFSILNNYVSEMESPWDPTPADLSNPNSPMKGRISQTTPGYSNLCANMRFDNILNKKIFFSLHAYNLLKQKMWYAPTYDNMSFLPKGSIQNSILINATLGIKFK